MFKPVFVFVVALATSTMAGYIGGPILDHGPAYALPAVAHAPAATSYQNSNLISLGATPVVAAHAPVVAHAPAFVAHAPIAPLAVAHAPVLPALSLGHGWH